MDSWLAASNPRAAYRARPSDIQGGDWTTLPDRMAWLQSDSYMVWLNSTCASPSRTCHATDRRSPVA